ncbi:gamma-glutamyltransferase [Marinobacter nanhaiticus D15-8W]|uniref:Gamma-glutamyltransferase n=1 Tax=Marinobacter nanhaiticus D15-8W TaxID=626887 RepID=N6WWB1_9GAMM|nr:gamma-glutamyltransferase [Marinobacter nanhaiticus]ENO15327.1 gamma-glutamyltransferase [Marinobacter nanhaiticus D15-8W]BES73828.1 gamma-glutamyltransferase [Marinobacter nanhaiticus D15-8W]
MTYPQKATSKGGVICTPHRQASEAGLAILDAGGTAIDATLAASAVLSVVYPHMTGLGGDAMWLLSDGRQVDAILGLGQAGQRLPDGEQITERGPASAATTAGALRSWSLALDWSRRQWGSRLGWSHLLEQAIGLAEEGMTLCPSQAFWQVQRRDLIASMPDLKAFCCDAQGELLSEGTTIRQPELAETLRQLARAGVDDFYDGDLALALSDGFRSLGNGLTQDDLRRTRAELCRPIQIRYRQGTLYNLPPPSQGLYTLRALHALDRVNIGAMPNRGVDYYHHLVEAIKAQLKNRNRQLCDPRHCKTDFLAQLSTAQAEADVRWLDPGRAAGWREPAHPADTVWFAASDRHGRTACLIQSLFHDFGSGCFIGDTGVLWLNRAAGFDPAPHHPNAWAPGKRPAHTLNPSCYLADDGRQFYFGTQGGDGQPQTQMVLATQLIDYEQTIEAALSTPRFLLGRSFFGSSENLKLEAPIGDDVASGLIARGHELEWLPELSPFTGQAGAIALNIDGQREAMHDPRGQGVSLGQTTR